MAVEHQPAIVGIIEAHKEYHPNAKVIVEGDISLINVDERIWLCIVVSELLGNCLKKEGVTTAKIKIKDGCLVVEDDVIHKNVGEILANLNSKQVKSDRKDRKGSGIWGARTLLADHDGKLEYYTEGGRIIAVAAWVE